jgi:hypothetical protein
MTIMYVFEKTKKLRNAKEKNPNKLWIECEGLAKKIVENRIELLINSTRDSFFRKIYINLPAKSKIFCLIITPIKLDPAHPTIFHFKFTKKIFRTQKPMESEPTDVSPVQMDPAPVSPPEKPSGEAPTPTKPPINSSEPAKPQDDKPKDPPKKDKMEIDPKVLKDLLSRTEKMKQQIKDLNNQNNSLTNQLSEKTRLLGESTKVQKLSAEVLDGKCKALQSILDETSSKNEELTNRLKDSMLVTENLKRESKMAQGEIRFFTEKYKDEFPKDRRICELEALVKKLQGENERFKNQSKINQIENNEKLKEQKQIKLDIAKENQ